MSHYEERLENDIGNIRKQIDKLAASVVSGMENAIKALLTGDEALASDVVLADGPVNRKMREIDAMCHSFMAVHLPSGSHLRQVSSIIRINITLERIGDYAVTIARELVQLSSKPDGEIARHIEEMSASVLAILADAMSAFQNDDAQAARETMKKCNTTVSSFDQILSALTKEQDKRQVTDLFALFVVFHHLVRVSDQAKNLCEDTVFAVTGETKAKKVYKVLFVDEDNSCLSKMAQAIASKSHSHGGSFSSAGRNPAASLHADLKAFLNNRGVDLQDNRAGSIADLADSPDDYHVEVSLQGEARSYLDHVPFHTTLLGWDVGEIPAEGDSEQRLDEIYKSLAIRIRDLMLLLRGEESA